MATSVLGKSDGFSTHGHWCGFAGTLSLGNSFDGEPQQLETSFPKGCSGSGKSDAQQHTGFPTKKAMRKVRSV